MGPEPASGEGSPLRPGRTEKTSAPSPSSACPPPPHQICSRKDPHPPDLRPRRRADALPRFCALARGRAGEPLPSQRLMQRM